MGLVVILLEGRKEAREGEKTKVASEGGSRRDGGLKTYQVPDCAGKLAIRLHALLYVI